MLRIVALAVVVTLAAAQTKYCCTSDQWEGFIGEVAGYVEGGTGHIINGSISMSYDFTNTMMAQADNLMVDGKMQMIKVIWNYQTKMMYTIMGSTCTPSPLTGDMMKLCVPDNAIAMGAIYYGQTGAMLTADTYMIPLGSDATVFASVTQTNPCTPIGEVIFGTVNKRPTVQNMGYVNITTGIKDPSVFTPPASCSSAMILKDAPVLDHRLMNYMHQKVTSP